MTVLPEAAYFSAAHLGPKADQQLVRSVVSGELVIEELTIPISAAMTSLNSSKKGCIVGAPSGIP